MSQRSSTPDQRRFRKVTGLRVRDLRQGAGLSQTELAELLTERGAPFNQPAIVRLESGQRILSVEEALALAQVLNIEIDVLLDDTDDVELSALRMQQNEARMEIADRRKKIAAMEAKISEYKAAIPELEREI